MYVQMVQSPLGGIVRLSHSHVALGEDSKPQTTGAELATAMQGRCRARTGGIKLRSRASTMSLQGGPSG